MVDEMFDRNYQAARAQLNDGVRAVFGGIGHAVGKSLKVMHRIEWSAPWAAADQPKGRA